MADAPHNTPAGNASPNTLRPVLISALLDLAFVVVFVLIGRRSHEEGVLSIGTVNAVWPFVVGAAVGWVASRAWRNPFGWVNPGLIIWCATVVVGMLLRVVSGQGVQLSFVIVASVFTGLFLIGWRLVAGIMVRRGRARVK